MKKTTLYFLVALHFTTTHLGAEVQRVTITWNSIMCNIRCGQLIEKKFKELREVQQVAVSPSIGVANLTWKPYVPFSYAPVKTAMQMVGAGVNDIRVRVRGKVRFEGDEVALYSIGDNTRFLLVSPLSPDPLRQLVEPHPSLRQMNPGLRERILRDVQQDMSVVVEGPLYRPASAWPLTIVIERMQPEKSPEPAKTSS